MLLENRLRLLAGNSLGIWLAVICVSASVEAANLKRVQVTDGSRIDLLFDSKIQAKQIKTEFFGDIVQLSLSDVSVYPARVSSVSGGDITKVFAYQYAPKLVRCRLTVKGGAESIKGRLDIRADGKGISIRIPNEKLATQSAAPVRETENESNLGDSEKALLDRVMKSTPIQKEVKESKEADLPVVKKPLTDAKPLPSPFRSFAMLGIVLAAFFACVLLFKKLKGAKQTSASHSKSTLSRIMAQVGGTFTGTQKEKMIEVIANHHIGPKKSISVVRVGDRQLVLGITNESINLITQLQASNDSEFEQIAMDSIAESFETAKPAGNQTRLGNLIANHTPPIQPSIRSQIRSKLEGYKPL